LQTATKVTLVLLLAIPIVWLLSFQSQVYPEYCEKIDECAHYNLFVYGWLVITHFIHVFESFFLVALTFAIAAFTFTLWRSTDKLWLAGEKQIANAEIAANAAKATAEALIATERSRLFIVINRHNLQQSIEFLCGSQEDVLSKEQELCISYSFKNYGKTPAIIRESSHFLIKALKPPDEPTYFPVDIIESEIAISYDKSTRDRSCVLDPSSRINQQEAIAVFQSRTTLWFYGQVIYDDVLGGQGHEHRFLWKYNGASHGFRPCYDYPEYIKNT
jgi:hypothetical protein